MKGPRDRTGEVRCAEANQERDSTGEVRCAEANQEWTIRPLGARISVEPDPDPVEHSSVRLHHAWRERWRTGRVAAVGSGKDRRRGYVVFQPLTVAPGDRIIFPRFAGADITIDGKLYTVLREEEVFGWLI